MSKTIVKHGGGTVGKSDYENALAVIRQGDNRGPSLSAAVPEIFDVCCVCAVHDKPYTLRFERQASGLYRFKESVRGMPSSRPDNVREGVKGYTMRMDYLENGATPCAWCGDSSFGHCSRDCGALVCCGRTKGNTFHCRPSCGASWVGVPMREISGSIGREDAPPRASLPPAPSKPRLLLPPGSSIPARWK